MLEWIEQYLEYFVIIIIVGYLINQRKFKKNKKYNQRIHKYKNMSGKSMHMIIQDVESNNIKDIENTEEIDNDTDTFDEDNSKYDVDDEIEYDSLEEMSYVELEDVNSDLDINSIVEPNQTSIVNFAAFTEQRITPDSTFIIDIWAYKTEQYPQIQEIVKELKREKIIAKKLGVPILDKTLLTVYLEVEGLEVEDSTDSIYWQGEAVNVSFIVNVPNQINKEKYIGKASILCNGIKIAKLSFNISVDLLEENSYFYNDTEVVYPETAFASYATENRAEVLARLQGVKQVLPNLDVFMDTYTLRSGDNWRQKLQENVPTKDVFYLFWSESAAKSKWVEREWKLALQERGLDYINPVPLVDPVTVKVPEELSDLHFSDPYIPYIEYEKMKLNNNV